MENLDNILKKVQHEISVAADLKALDDIRVAYLGKKGAITLLAKSLKDVPVAQKPLVGKQINELKQQTQNLLTARKEILEQQELKKKLSADRIDVTLPGRDHSLGSIHPITQTISIMCEFFASIGFDIRYGPEVENDFYNFGALNMPAHHPARAMQDTFYVETGDVLRTHTSPVQIRSMQALGAPMRVIAPGRVYRCDSDITHTPMFHQIEGLVIDKGISFAHLKQIIHEFLHHLFEADIPIRFRPSYFPFTEPSAEVDIGCVKCEAKGCRICKQTGWLEVLGCGMVHPNVLTAGDIDPNQYTGFAFGCGIERIAMLKYGIGDLRVFFENDLRFLGQFGA